MSVEEITERRELIISAIATQLLMIYNGLDIDEVAEGIYAEVEKVLGEAYGGDG